MHRKLAAASHSAMENELAGIQMGEALILEAGGWSPRFVRRTWRLSTVLVWTLEEGQEGSETSQEI